MLLSVVFYRCGPVPYVCSGKICEGLTHLEDSRLQQMSKLIEKLVSQHTTSLLHHLVWSHITGTYVVVEACHSSKAASRFGVDGRWWQASSFATVVSLNLSAGCSIIYSFSATSNQEGLHVGRDIASTSLPQPTNRYILKHLPFSPCATLALSTYICNSNFCLFIKEAQEITSVAQAITIYACG